MGCPLFPGFWSTLSLKKQISPVQWQRGLRKWVRRELVLTQYYPDAHRFLSEYFESFPVFSGFFLASCPHWDPVALKIPIRKKIETRGYATFAELSIFPRKGFAGR